LTVDEAAPCSNCGYGIHTEKFCPKCGAANQIEYIDETVKIDPAVGRIVRGMSKKKGRTTVKLAKALGIAAIVMMAASYFANSYALNNLQFRVREVTNFDYNSLSSSMRLDACNPTAFPASFDKVETVMNYQGEDFARMSIAGSTVFPYQSTSLDGKLALNADKVSGLVIALAAALSGQNTAYDENELSLTMRVDARILGVIPYSQTHQYTFSEFRQVMGAQPGQEFAC
jgi:hypothetical protein